MEPNVYTPQLAKIVQTKDEVVGARAIKTFRAEFTNGARFDYRCGQCAMLSVFGKGEAMISISSSPLITDYMQFSILRTGRVTSALHDLEVGDFIGVRGPYGNGFPIDGWLGKNLEFVGFVPTTVLEKKPSPANTIAITCGPPIMIKFVIKNLRDLKFEDEQIYTTVENKMKCGIGKCGRCNIGFHYVCKDGPVYSWAELKKLPQE